MSLVEMLQIVGTNACNAGLGNIASIKLSLSNTISVTYALQDHSTSTTSTVPVGNAQIRHYIFLAHVCMVNAGLCAMHMLCKHEWYGAWCHTPPTLNTMSNAFLPPMGNDFIRL